MAFARYACALLLAIVCTASRQSRASISQIVIQPSEAWGWAKAKISEQAEMGLGKAEADTNKLKDLNEAHKEGVAKSESKIEDLKDKAKDKLKDGKEAVKDAGRDFKDAAKKGWADHKERVENNESQTQKLWEKHKPVIIGGLLLLAMCCCCCCYCLCGRSAEPEDDAPPCGGNVAYMQQAQPYAQQAQPYAQQAQPYVQQAQPYVQPAQPVHQAQPNYIDCTCPPGCGPGSIVEVTLPNGMPHQVVVPEGVYAHMTFSVQV